MRGRLPNSRARRQSSRLPQTRPHQEQRHRLLPHRQSDGRHRRQAVAWGLLRARSGVAPGRRIAVVAATSAGARSAHSASTRRNRSITRTRLSCAVSSLTVAAAREGGGRAYARNINAGWLSPSNARATWRCSPTRRNIFDPAGRFLHAARLEETEPEIRGRKAFVVSSKLTQVVHGRPDG